MGSKDVKTSDWVDRNESRPCGYLRRSALRYAAIGVYHR